MKLEVRTRSEREDRMAVDKEKEKRDRDKERRARDRERGMHRDLEARVKETKEGGRGPLRCTRGEGVGPTLHLGDLCFDSGYL